MRNIAARAILAAEQAADRLVLLRGAKQREYARCFVNGLRNSAGLTRTDYELAPSFTPFDKKSRRERLNAILSADSHSPFGSRKAKALAIAGGFAAIGLAFAQAAFVVEPSEVRASLPQAPVDGKVTLGYKETSVALGDDRSAHEGVDIKAKRGAPVMAAGDGKVVAATSRYNNQPAWGKVVVIDHGHGLITRYAHLDNFVVTRGDVVLAGDTIGAVGSTGRSTGPHLHFEVLRDGEPVDPSPVIAAKPLPKPELKFEPVIAPKIEHALSIEPPIILASAAHDLMPIYDVSPAIMPAPTPEIDQEEIEKRLEGRFDELTARMSARFKDEEFVRDFDLDGYEFEGAEELSAELTKELAQEFADMRLSLAEIEGLNFDAFEFDGDGMLRFNGEFSEEEIARLKEEQHEAIERAHKEMERAHREAEKARQKKHRHAERERQRQMRLAERARETAERDRERSKHDADRARERAERDMERALERAEMRAERDFERLEREWERNPSEKYEGIDEEELLDIREKALREAQANLDAELKEIERERKRLNKKRKARNKD
ncbi:MAG: peptidoglycan DD-metalloendopeptidase family protein [Marinicaulis sp.]|nr:peptidoglycan DD-metalloendopeptidase family protein [Marinicaulis sp.]